MTKTADKEEKKEVKEVKETTVPVPVKDPETIAFDGLSKIIK